MDKNYDQYTYRAGRKVRLRKSDDELVIRRRPEQLSPDDAFVSTEQVSSASTRILTTRKQLEDVMARCRTEAPTHHAYYEESGDMAFLITDRIFVCFRDAPSDEDVGNFLSRYGLALVEQITDRDFLFQLTMHTGVNPVRLVVELNDNDAMVESAEHDLNHRATTYQIAAPTDPAYARQWHLHTDFHHLDYDHRACAMCEHAWQLLDGFGSSAITIAISDDGCRTDHSDFNSPDKFRSWAYFRGQRLVTADDIDASADEMWKPGANHGTSCAGVAAGEVDAQRVVGAAPGCKLLPIQFESLGPSLFISSSRMLKALNFIADDADIMSNSWGNVPINVWPTVVVNRMTQLAQTGGPRGKGILFLWAAGNDNCPINLEAAQDVPYTSGIDFVSDTPVWAGVATARTFENNLVGVPGVMHIAALASNARRSHYSNYGPGISLCSPTSNSHTYSRMVVRGLGVTSATGAGAGVTNSFGGTSSATPLVAGVAALVRSANPELTAAEVESILKRTASKGLDMSGYAPTSPAPYDMDTSWDVSPVTPFDTGEFTDNGDDDGSWSPWFGFGRVDARRAVADALNGIPTDGDAHFSESSSPNMDIPDNDNSGVEDSIHCGREFSVNTVRVRADITHTYVGDLRVRLAAPSGRIVALHDRSGGSSNDIHKEFDSENTPAMLAFRGEQSFGAWSLLVQDMAPVDVGELVRWELHLGGAVTQPVSMSDAPGLIIPDDQEPGLRRSLNVESSLLIGSVRVALDITHTYIGDLRVTLHAPDGTSVMLHDRSGANRDNLIQDFDLANTPALQALVGKNPQGDWELHVTDNAPIDQGKLNAWGLTFE